MNAPEIRGLEVLPLGNGQILLRGAAVVHCWRAVNRMIKTGRIQDGLAPESRLVHLERDLRDAAAFTLGHSGRPQTPNLEPLTGEAIDTEEAADMLQLSTRQVRRLAADLGGRRAGRRWTFDPALVKLYAKERSA